jgi:hypothetical protein
MENCNTESIINNMSYRRIRDLTCHMIEPYHEKNNKKNNKKNNINVLWFATLLIIFIIFIIRSFFYQIRAISLFK